MDAEYQPERLKVNSPGLHEATPGKGSLPYILRRQDVGALIAGGDDRTVRVNAIKAIRWLFTILTALILVGGGYLVCTSSGDLLVTALISLVVVGGITLLMWKHPNNTGLHITASVLLVVSLFLAVASVFAASMFLYEARSARKYDYVMKRYWKTNPLVAHFPRPVPAEATDVQFYYQTTLGMGGSDIQLAYTTTPQEIHALYRRFARMKTTSTVSLKDQEWLYPGGILATAKKQPPISPIPADYEVMAFDKLPPGKTWDRLGEGHGVMISKKQHRIVYWAQYWDAPQY